MAVTWKKLVTEDDITTYLKNIVEDTTPQLGGDLDLNGNNIDFPTTPDISDCLDEDDMASDSDTSLATQQSIKTYVDSVNSQKYISVVATEQADGELNLTGFGGSKVLITEIKITPSASTDFDVEIYESDDFTTSLRYLGENIDSNGLWDLVQNIIYEDQDDTEELHIKITNNAGGGTFDIEVRGLELR